MEIIKWIFRKIMINKVYISRKKMRKRREKSRISVLPSQEVDIKKRKISLYAENILRRKNQNADYKTKIG